MLEVGSKAAALTQNEENRMRIIISPAKKMNRDDGLLWKELPAFLEQTQQLMNILKQMDAASLQKLWKCNDQIAAQNVQRLQTMKLRGDLTPAILAYEGIQYRYMAPDVFTQKEYDYVQAHLKKARKPAGETRIGFAS